MKVNYLILLAILFSGILMFPSCGEDGPGTVTLEFEHVFDGNAFSLNTDYTLASGEKASFSTIKYYVSGIELSNDDGSLKHQVNDYFLVDASQEASRFITLTEVPEGDYTKVKFLLGVDSTRNVSGAQEGALDVANGMFWSWNMGYIFVKFEGTAQDTTQFRYHIGGFRTGMNNLKTLEFTAPMDMEVKGSDVDAHFMVDIAEFFKNPTTWNITNKPEVMQPNANAMMISSNYSDMFMLHHIHND